MTDTNTIFNIDTEKGFEVKALEVFRYQFHHNKTYRSFCDLLYKHPSDVASIKDIPFLPIQFFKSHTIVSNTHPIELVFTSSGTTGSTTSKHHVTDIGLYENSFRMCFNHFYGDIEDYTILALLPNYLEREGSSLVYMVNDLIKRSKHIDSGFYLNDIEALHSKLKALEQQQRQTLLIGVSFALLDLIERYTFDLNHTIIMETGGMKGRRKELIRKELHEHLREGFNTQQIHSEYGMTELLSQAYSLGNGIFNCPPWMKVLTRETEDPLTLKQDDKTGGINIIDLANINSCAFIATQDLGRVFKDGSFEVIGRFDHSDIRGCNLMAL